MEDNEILEPMKPIEGIGPKERREDKKYQFEYDQVMTVGDLIDYLLQLDLDLEVTTSVFRPRQGLIYKAPVKYSQLKVGRGCVYINNYLQG